jgi:biotin transport system ATP-binding protein
MNAFIQAQELRFRHNGAEKETLKGISFHIEAGQISCLVGVNGSGKTTLLNLLAGIYTPADGILSIAGQILPDKKGTLKGKSALVPQDPDLYILGSLVEEDLVLALDPTDHALRQKAIGLAERFGLSDLLDQPVHMLSYGQKRKLCLASALAVGPELLLLDEPFTGLDYPATLATREALQQNKESGLTQVISGHDLDVMADLADIFILLQHGELLRIGGKSEVFPLLQEAGVRPPCWWFTNSSEPLWKK